MKNTIKYYYNFDNINLIRSNGSIYIKYKQEIYVFCRIINRDETLEIYSLTRNMPNFYQFVINKDNSIFTTYQNNLCVLLKVTPKKNITFKPNRVVLPYKNYLLDRSNWYELWTKKNDYFEYQQHHIYGKFKIIDESINYYIGLAENAISYISYNIRNETIQEQKTICHKRIDKNGYFNPLNCVIDYKERDLAEYLKYIFLNKQYLSLNLEKIVISFNSTKREYTLLFGRLLYPSFYFDLYERIINNYDNENKLIEIIKRNKEYEEYLKNIYSIINKYTDIKKVDWL